MCSVYRSSIGSRFAVYAILPSIFPVLAVHVCVHHNHVWDGYGVLWVVGGFLCFAFE